MAREKINILKIEYFLCFQTAEYLKVSYLIYLIRSGVLVVI